MSYLILINGNSGQTFAPFRGLYQGYPLSPYLFILCAEALSNLIRKAKSQSLLKGYKISHRAPVVSHLFFLLMIALFLIELLGVK